MSIFRTLSSDSLISKEKLKSILDETFSKNLRDEGLTWDGNYLWKSQFNNGVAKILQYLPLKGGQGTIVWGVCLDFLPIVTSGRIEYNRTFKSIKPHLFENTDEYFDSFSGGSLKGGVISEWGENNAITSTRLVFEKYFQKVLLWYRRAETLEGLVEVASNQLSIGKAYNYRSPSPKYVLSYLLAKARRLEEAEVQFETAIEDLDDNILIEKLRSKLLTLGA
jgi:hypothetical protein